MTEAFFVVLGLCFGSLGSVLISRVPQGLPPTGRSKCPGCQKILTPKELIPIVSFLFCRGRCRGCHMIIGMIYPFIEISSGAIFLFAYWYTGAPFSAVLLALALWLLLVVAIIDAKTHTIADVLNVPFVFLALSYGLLIGGFDYLAPIIGAGFFVFLWLVSRGKWIGSGDIILGAGIGALIGSWKMMVASLMMTYILGALIISILIITKKVTHGSHVAFAPFLFLGTLATLIFTDRIQQLLWLYF